MNGKSQSGASGFSLVELIIAMAVTLIVSAAIYGLLTGGQNAFRREPELADRQQNIRLAMDVIMRDVANAGSGLTPYMQTFTPGLDACTGCPDGGAPMGPNSVRTDELELIANSIGRDTELACQTPGKGNASIVTLTRGSATVPPGTVALFVMDDGTFSVRNVVNVTQSKSGSGDCDAGTTHASLSIAQGKDSTGLNQPSGVCEPNGWGNVPPGSACRVAYVSFAQLIRYRIRSDAQGVPVLQRWTSEDAANFNAGAASASGYQTLARGIEDFQVQYTTVGAPAAWVDGAPTVTLNDPRTMIHQVRVTLAARAEARNIQGATTSASGGTRIRGSLTSTGTPRSVLIHVTAVAPSPSPGPLWN